jgi:predicted DNA-binding transcriptional regulator AlpA
MTPAGLRETDAAAYLGISRMSLRRHGPPPVRIGRAVVWPRATLDQWLASKSATAPAMDADQATERAIDAIRQNRTPSPRRRKR